MSDPNRWLTTVDISPVDLLAKLRMLSEPIVVTLTYPIGKWHGDIRPDEQLVMARGLLQVLEVDTVEPRILSSYGCITSQDETATARKEG